MDSILEEIQRLVKATVLVKPEQAIFRVLNQINENILQNSSQNFLSQLENLLGQLVKSNKGEISTQCSIYIGQKQAQIYKYFNIFNPTNLISEINSNSTSSQLIAFGSLAKSAAFSAQNYKEIINILMKVPETSYFASLYSVKCCLRGLKGNSPEIDNEVLHFVQKVLNSRRNEEEMILIHSLKVLAVLGRRNNIQNHNSLLTLIHQPYKNQNTSLFVHDEATKTAAHFAAAQILNSSSNPHFDSIKEILSGFKDSLSVFKYFSTIVGPVLISKYSDQLLSLFLNNFPLGLQTILNFSSQESKMNLFTSITNQMNVINSERFEALMYFVENTEVTNQNQNQMIFNIANYALKLYESDNLYDRENSSQFFSQFSNKYREASYNFVCFWLDKLDRNEISDDKTWLSATSIVSKIVLSSQDRDLLIQANQQQLMHIQTAGLNSKSIFSNIFIGTWFLLSFIPEQLIDSNLVIKNIDRILENIISNLEDNLSKLFESLLQFYLIHPNAPHIQEVTSYAVQYLSTLTPGAISSLCTIIPKIYQNDPKIITMYRTILSYTLSIKATQDMLHQFVSKTEPDEESLLNDLHKPPIHTYEDTKMVVRLVNTIPLLILSAPSKIQGELIEELINHPNVSTNAVHRFVLKAVVENEKTRQIIPRGFLIPLLKSLKGSDKIFLQSTCETVSTFISYHESFIKATVNFIEQNKSRASLYLLSSIVNHVHVSNDFLVRLMICANERTNSQQLKYTALYAMLCIITSHPMDVSSLCLGAHQLTVLMNILHDDTLNSSLPSPMTIHLVSRTLISLLPTLVPDCLEPNSPLKSAIISVVDSFMTTPLTIAKDEYFICLHNICLYTFEFIQYLDLQYESATNNSLLDVRIRALSTYSQYISRFPINEQIFSFFKPAIHVLQQTNAQQAKEFILSVCCSFTSQNGVNNFNQVYTICPVINNILQKGTIPDLNSNVKASKAVVMCVLQAASEIINALLNLPEIPLLLLNDLLASICISATNEEYECRQQAFNSICKILEIFKQNKKYKQIVKHYYSQLLTVCKVGLSSGVSICSKYLSEFLYFTKDKEETFKLFAKELKNSQVNNFNSQEFLQVASRFCKVLSERNSDEAKDREEEDKLNKEFIDQYKDTFEIISQSFTNIIKQAMEIIYKQNDTTILQEFRQYVSDFYEDLSPSFIYLLSYIDNEEMKKIDKRSILSFSIVELRTAQDIWQAKGGLAAIAYYVKYFSGKDIDLIREALEVVCSLIPQVGGAISKFSSILIENLLRYNKELFNDRMWDILVYTALNCPSKSTVFLDIIDHFSSAKFNAFCGDLIVAALNSYCDSYISEEEIKALYVLMLSKDKNSQKPISFSALDWCEKSNRITLGFKLATLSIQPKSSFEHESKAAEKETAEEKSESSNQEENEQKDTAETTHEEQEQTKEKQETQKSETTTNIPMFENVDIEEISNFCSRNVRNGGLEFYINSTMSSQGNNNLELELLARGGLNTIFGFCMGDSYNNDKYISLISDVFRKFDHKMDVPLLKLCVNCINNWQNDKLTLSKYAQLLKELKEEMGDEFSKSWDNLSQQEKEACIYALQNSS